MTHGDRPLPDGFAIRAAVAHDEDSILDICVRTADCGKDGRHLYSNPRYPGLLWAAPYLRFAPDHAFVLEKEGRVLGYAVGAGDTAAFAEDLERGWWPMLRTKLKAEVPSAPGDAYVFDYIRQPEEIADAINSIYPAHLHINLTQEAQGHGRGSTLLRQLITSLAASGAQGVHLGVNQHNEAVTAFYRKFGFAEIARNPSIIMGRSLRDWPESRVSSH